LAPTQTECPQTLETRRGIFSRALKTKKSVFRRAAFLFLAVGRRQRRFRLKLLNVKEVAELLGVPVSFVYDRTRRSALDAIPHLKVGKYVRFDLEKVERWLADRQRGDADGSFALAKRLAYHENK
jgi:excisionase family DNA binding protein